MSLVINRASASLATLFGRLHLSVVNRAIRRLLEHVPGGSNLRVTADGLVFEGPIDSWRVLNQISSGTLEPYTLDLFSRSLRPGMTVLDIGANIGYYTVHAARAVGPTGRVVAFEPDPRTAASLRSNLHANSVQDSVVVHECAASSSTGTRRLFLSSTAAHSGLHATMDERSVVRAMEVEAVTVDDVLQGANVDVVKLDVEGEESAVLRGMEQTIASSPRLRLFVEFNPLAFRATGASPEGLLEQLRSTFDEVHVIDERARRLVSPTPSALSGLRNLLCTKGGGDSGPHARV
ncbi:MAG: FkbM family methyltransferase [Mycobacteriales bacterium]